jgi:hypothetical protein
LLTTPADHICSGTARTNKAEQTIALDDYFFCNEVPTQTPGRFFCLWLHREPDGQSLEVSQWFPAALSCGFGVATQTPGLFLYLWLHREPAGQSFEVSHGFPAAISGGAGVLTQTPGLFGCSWLHLEPAGQSLEVSQGFPAATAAPPGNDQTTKTVSAARITDRSGFFTDASLNEFER